MRGYKHNARTQNTLDEETQAKVAAQAMRSKRVQRVISSMQHERRYPYEPRSDLPRTLRAHCSGELFLKKNLLPLCVRIMKNDLVRSQLKS